MNNARAQNNNKGKEKHGEILKTRFLKASFVVYWPYNSNTRRILKLGKFK